MTTEVELTEERKKELLERFDAAAAKLNLYLPEGNSFVRINLGKNGKPDKCIVIYNSDRTCVWKIEKVNQKKLLKKGYKKLLLKDAGKAERRARNKLKKVDETNFHTSGKVHLREQLFGLYNLAEEYMD